MTKRRAPSATEAEAVVIPGDPARLARLALWHPRGVPEAPTYLVDDDAQADDSDEAEVLAVGDELPSTIDEVSLVLPAGQTVRRRAVKARLVPWGAALDWLATLEPSGELRPSLVAWAVAARRSIGLVARGRIVPGTSASGADQWSIGMLDPDDERFLADLAGAFPATAHALVDDTGPAGPLRLLDPEWLIRHAFDATADALVRSPAAALTTAVTTFAGADITRSPALQAWGRALDQDLGRGSGARPGLRIEWDDRPPAPEPEGAPAAAADPANPVDGVEPAPSPEQPDQSDQSDQPDQTDQPGQPDKPDEVVEDTPRGPELRAILQLRSHLDPSLVVDVADLWDAPDPVLALLGTDAESDLLVALRRGSRAWPPLARALEQRRPDVLAITDEEAIDLLGPAADELTAAGFEVLWPIEMLSTPVELEAVVTGSSLSADGPGGLHLGALVNFDWRASLGGEHLTDEEMQALAEAKRPLVRLRGRWVTADPKVLERLREPGQARASDILAGALADGLVIDGETVPVELRGGPLAELAVRLRLLGADTPREMSEPVGLVATLRPYQRRGLAWLTTMTDLGLGGCLADDMGLGKTIQLIALHVSRHGPGRADPVGPTLVVCPTSLLGNWEREINRFAPGVAVRRYHGGERSLDDVGDNEIVLVTYGVVRRDAGALAVVPWDIVAADEAQHAKNPLSRTAKAMRAIPSRTRLALTGTPVENRLTELWSILDWANPGLLGTLETFRATMAVPIERHHDEEATARLAATVRPFLLRRRKSDPGIAPELPPKTEQDLVVPLTAEQVTLYEATVREILDQISGAEGMSRRGLVLKLLTGLKQITNHPAQFLHQNGPLRGRSGKLAALDELLDVIRAEGDAALIFTQYVQMGKLLEQHLASRGIAHSFLHGGVPVHKREEMVDGFQAGAVPVMLLSLKAGGTGLNLTAANHVVHFDRWWNPAVEDQATDRAYRIGQDRPVQVHRLVTEGTIEDRIAQLLAAKRGLADSVVGAGEAWLSELSDDELADLVTLRNPDDSFDEPAPPSRRGVGPTAEDLGPTDEDLDEIDGSGEPDGPFDDRPSEDRPSDERPSGDRDRHEVPS